MDESSAVITTLAQTPTLGAHEPVTLTVSLQLGRYAMDCTVPHHYVRDQMVATLVVS